MTRRAMTLLELMLVLALGVLILSMGVTSMRRTAQESGSKALADLLVEEFKAARALAIVTQSPVGISLSGPISQSLRRWEGTSQARMTRVVNFQGDFPDCKCFVGIWDVDPTQLKQPALTPGLGMPSSGRNLGSFQLASWIPATFADNLLVFTPSGNVVSNDLPLYDNSYHVLVGKGIEAAAVSPSLPGVSSGRHPSAYYQASRVSDAFCVSLTSEGWASSSRGVPAAGPALALGSGTFGENGPRIALTRLGPNHNPEIVQIKLNPVAVELLNAGETGLVEANGYLTLTTVARG
ncbi:MAG: hypothetical protein U0931_15555 [Vulcanimicrobiota bacterium]